MEQPEISFQRELEAIQHQGICIVQEDFTSSPIESLCIEANLNPYFTLRRCKLALQYPTKLVYCPQNPAYNCIMKISYKTLFWK